MHVRNLRFYQTMQFVLDLLAVTVAWSCTIQMRVLLNPLASQRVQQHPHLDRTAPGNRHREQIQDELHGLIKTQIPDMHENGSPRKLLRRLAREAVSIS